MSIITSVFDLMLNLDKYLGAFITNYGIITYGVLFLIIFLETGLVVTPFLPGDSLIFAAGAFAALGLLNFFVVIVILAIAAILGDTLNYHLGKLIGKKVGQKENSQIVKKEYIDTTNEYFEKYGGKTIIIARFIPIVRTCAPFVAGIGEMHYRKFLIYNAIGGTAWVMVATLCGYFFGNIPVIKDNFSMVILAIVFISILPAIYEFVKSKIDKRKIIKS